MLFLDLQAILNSIPNQVRWEDTVQIEKLDERVALANDVCANIIGVIVENADATNYRTIRNYPHSSTSRTTTTPYNVARKTSIWIYD